MKKLIPLTLAMFMGVSAIGTAASEIWRINGLGDVLRGDARGVSISSEGVISPGPALKTLLDSGERLAWSAVADSKGDTYVGTGGSGKLYALESGKNPRVLATLPEANVTALAIGANDELFAATSPDGNVYRIHRNGAVSKYFSPGEKYIWALVAMPDGKLAVATGDGGRIYKVAGEGVSREKALVFDSPETNITTLALGSGGILYAGTDPNGLVLGINPDGKAFAILDSPLREIRDISIDGESIFILAVAESVSTATTDGEEKKSPTSVQVVKASAPEAPTRSRNDTSAAKSIVYRASATGAQEIVWNSATISAFSILASRNGNVLIGTADKGRIFSIDRESKQSLLVQTDELQISKMIRAGASIVAVSGAGAKAIGIGPGEERNPVYVSSILDAKNVARWGRLSWSGKGSPVIELRSGNVEQPDDTWSEWRQASQETGKATLPNARFLQWRVSLGTGATIGEMSAAFDQLNIAPEVISLQVLPTNVGLAPNIQIPNDPNIEASGMDPALFGLPSGVMPPRKLYQRGAVSLQWTAEDRNGDRMLFDLMVRRIDESEYKTIRRDMSDNFVTVDGLTLADGIYVFKVVARDVPSNQEGGDLLGSLTSEPVAIDNAAPMVTQYGGFDSSGADAMARFEAIDRGGRINRAEYSINGGDWRTVIADDGVNDDSVERFTIRFQAQQKGEFSIVLRVHDFAGNSGSTRVVFNKK
jgi:hypothetical protein